MVQKILSLQACQLVGVMSDYYRGTNPWDSDVLEFFKLQGSDGSVTFWKHHIWGNYTSEGAVLQEVSAEVYERGVKTLLADADKYNEKGEYDDGAYRYTLVQKNEQEIIISIFVYEKYGRVQFEGTRIEYTSPISPVASFIAEALADYRKAISEKRAEEAIEHKKYAQECGRTARRLGINFVNVLRLGYEDEEELLAFKKAMERAKQMIKASDTNLQDYLYHEIMESGRARKQEALASLGIVVKADVNHMSFDELFD